LVGGKCGNYESPNASAAARVAALIAWMPVVRVDDLAKGGANRRPWRVKDARKSANWRSMILDKIVNANTVLSKGSRPLSGPFQVSDSNMTESKTQRPARNFANVETWVFDLDNTLYPHHLNLWQQVDVRIRDYIVDFLKITHDEAFRLQKDYYKRYGTTMRGLMAEHGLQPDEFLEMVHQIDHSPLTPNPALGAAIAQLSGRKLILTNGTREHADAVLRRLEIGHHFDDVFDIRAAELEPKPQPVVYERFLARHDVDPNKAAIFEDLARNLEVPHALGMTTVLVVPQGARVVLREDWELAGRDAPHVDHVTDDLAGFLRGIDQR
jgi:putative hydrolase of the HAD superfamily